MRVSSVGYDLPSPLPAARPGTLISSRLDVAKAVPLGAARAWQVLYHSTDLNGLDIAVSGLVLVPSGRPPAGGWTLAAWAHGTTGLADQCAPSIAARNGNDASAVREIRALLAQHLAVVASDYPGLGTPGVHTYLIGQSDARAVVDAVTAAHTLLGAQLARRWLTVGHSEGGQTALFVAQLADGRAPQWPFLGTVALAPASQLHGLIPFAEGTADPVEQAYLLYALEGLSAVDPSVRVASLLTRQARAVLPDTTRGCIDDITNDLARHHVTRLLDASPETEDHLDDLLGRYDDPDHGRAAEPVLIAQGEADQDVPEVATGALVKSLCGLGDRVTYRLIPGLDHNDLISGARSLIAGWIAALVAQQPPPSTCPGV